MSLIATGKDGYNAIEEFSARTTKELTNQQSRLFLKDTSPPAEEIRFVLDSLDGCQAVLELGSGLGPWGTILRAGGLYYVGVEPVLERVLYARSKVEGVPAACKFIHDDARTVRLHGGAPFDAVLLVTVLQHMTLPDAISTLVTAAEHLEPGGRVIMLESRIFDLDEEACDRIYAHPENAAHMIPKPLRLLQQGEPRLSWKYLGHGDRYILTKKAE